MPARVIDPAIVAASFRAQLRTELAALPGRLKLLGLLAEGNGPSATYAEYTRKGCEEVGMDFELRAVLPATAASEVRRASEDPAVHGILVYYPIAGGESDDWLREIVDPRKDIEGLHSFWARCLYENRRFIDAARTQRAILPSTPLAVLKLLEAAGVFQSSLARPGARFDPGHARPLEGVRVCVINRSKVVGHPLAAMLAHDGAEVISFDIDGPLAFVPGDGQDAHRTRRSLLTRAEALAAADVVITGVPSRAFPLVRSAELKPGAVCLNFSTLRNFDPDVLETASVFVPRVGPMTVTMALRNTVRLHKQTQTAGQAEPASRR